MNFVNLIEIIKQRQSIRLYERRSIPENDLLQVIDAARYAPTARGEEPWEFIIVTRRDCLGKIAEITDHGKFIKDASACCVVLCRDTKYYLEDGCAATQNILLAATALGIDSCWVAGDKKAYASKILEYFDVPHGFHLVSLIALGYRISDVQRRKRRLLGEVLHREKFTGKG